MEYLVDWRGTPIVPGAIVVYPGRKSSWMWMIEARVLEITEMREWNVTHPAIRVQPLRQGSYGRTNMKPVKLTALERVTVIDSPTENTLAESVKGEADAYS